MPKLRKCKHPQQSAYYDRKWEANFKELKEYKKMNGHCNVPARHPELGDWVKTQRRAFKNKNLLAYRMKLLQDIGFSWEVSQSKGWDANFKELKKYKAENGNCIVPLRHPELGSWVNNQRTAYKNENLSKERINSLKEIGFSWEVHNDGWEAKFKQLEEYKAENGHCNVPQSHPELGIWVNTQRSLYKKGNLLDDRIKRLQDIGFQWVVPRGPRPRARPQSPPNKRYQRMPI